MGTWAILQNLLGICFFRIALLIRISITFWQVGMSTSWNCTLNKIYFANVKQKQLSYMKEKETELAIAQSEASELRTEFLKLKRWVIVNNVLKLIHL